MEWSGKMLSVKSMDVRNNFKTWCKTVAKGETVVISRPKNENVYMISEKEYNELQKARKNAEYLAMLNKSIEQLENGEVVTMNLEELEKLTDE